jgi:uncharacterized protein (UPF0276 family)
MTPVVAPDRSPAPLGPLAALPRLGLGLSTEFDAAKTGIDAEAITAAVPGLFDFLEVGVDLARGLDEHARRWANLGRPTTYHFLDVNLAEPEDVDPTWAETTAALAGELGAAWLCGDGGLWHFGPRDRGHMTLLPPILSPASARDMAEGVRRVQALTGLRCLPENPPGTVFLGDLHLLDYFARVVTDADTGLLLDCAHLAIFQKLRGLDPLTGLDGFPLERIVELHVAGGRERDHDGFVWVDDDHSPEPLAETWRIFEHVMTHAPHIKAVVYECERNAPAEVLTGFARLRQMVPAPEPRAP